MIYQRIKSLHAAQLLLGHIKLESIVRYLGIEVDDALEIAEQTHPENAGRVINLVRGSDLLFIEAGFLHQDAERAAQKHHLTARQAGSMAREAGAKSVIPLHFSPSYSDREALLRQELEDSFGLQPNA